VARVHSMQLVPTPPLTPPKASSKTMPPYGEHGGSIASSKLRQRTQKERTWTPSAGGNTNLYYTSGNEVHGSASLKTSHFAGPEGNREVSPVRKRVRPPYLMYINYKLLQQDRNKNYETKITTVAASSRPQTKYFCSMSTFHVYGSSSPVNRRNLKAAVDG
jgi:hypothetical protein